MEKIIELYVKLDLLESKLNETAEDAVKKLTTAIDAMRLARDDMSKDLKRVQEQIALMRTTSVVAKAELKRTYVIDSEAQS